MEILWSSGRLRQDPSRIHHKFRAFYGFFRISIRAFRTLGFGIWGHDMLSSFCLECGCWGLGFVGKYGRHHESEDDGNLYGDV